MTPPSGPLEVFQSAARSVLGRAFCFFVACSLGGGAGNLVYQLSLGATSFPSSDMLLAMSVVPLAILSVLASYGAFIFPACLLVGFLFIRYDLSFWWLLTPFTLVAWQTYLMLN